MLLSSMKMDLSASTSPWSTPTFARSVRAPLDEPVGMLGSEERLMLHWLTREGFSGRGQVIDAGAFVGASAFALASGLAERTSFLDPGVKVHSFDYFQAMDRYVIDDITQKFRKIAMGDSYLDIFQRQTSAYKDWIIECPGDFSQYSWNQDKIGVLFIDICKTQNLNSRVIQNFFPHLVPNASFVVHQDFYHVWHPYIHVTMQFLRNYFEVQAHRVVFQSKLYLLREPIPAWCIGRAVSYDFSPQEKIELLDQLVHDSPPPVAQMAELIGIYQRLLDRDHVGYLAAWNRFREAWTNCQGEFPRDQLWGVQALQVKATADRLFG